METASQVPGIDDDEHPMCLGRLLTNTAGGVDPAGLEMMGLVRMLANHYDAVVTERLRDVGLSGPRLGLLIRLSAEEAQRGMVSPTHLSRCLNVSKNTVSALLRGLEDQGLVERALDPDDRRMFHMRVSAAGQALLAELTPAYLDYANELMADLSDEDRAALGRLLLKLHRSLVRHCGLPGFDGLAGIPDLAHMPGEVHVPSQTGVPAQAALSELEVQS